jgi:hypothetical protein
VCAKFCFPLGKTKAENVTVLKEAFKEEAMGKTPVHEWFNHLKRGEMSVEDQSHCGHPSTSRTDENVKKFDRLSLQIVVGSLLKFINNRCVTEFMLSHFNGRFGVEMVCCKIRAACAHRGAKQQACKCLL